MTQPQPSRPPLSRGEQARVNGAASRGPVSEEGRDRSSRNRTSHGLYAVRHCVLEGEDEAAFQALHDRLVDEHAPSSAVDEALVERLAATIWKLRRADAMERQQQRVALAEPIAAEPGETLPAPLLRDLPRFLALERHQGRLTRELAQLTRLLDQRRQQAAREARDRLRDEARAEAAEASAELRAMMDAPDPPGSPLCQRYEDLLRAGRRDEARAVMEEIRASVAAYHASFD